MGDVRDSLKKISEPVEQYVKSEILNKGYCLVCHDNVNVEVKHVLLYLLNRHNVYPPLEFSPDSWSVWSDNVMSYSFSPEKPSCVQIGDTFFYYNEVYYCFGDSVEERFGLAEQKMLEIKKDVGYYFG